MEKINEKNRVITIDECSYTGDVANDSPTKLLLNVFY
jgi:hypothetical protein